MERSTEQFGAPAPGASAIQLFHNLVRAFVRAVLSITTAWRAANRTSSVDDHNPRAEPPDPAG